MMRYEYGEGSPTPLIRVETDSLPAGASVLAKLEGMNPGLSVKDRPARRMLWDLVRSGRTGLLDRVVEASSGNMAVSLALAASRMGVPLWLFVPETAGSRRIDTARKLGAEVTVTPGELGTQGAQRVAAEAAGTSRRLHYLGQHGNRGNPDAHYSGTGPEIWAQSGGTLSGFAAGIGTGGTLLGVSRFLREADRGIAVAGTAPDSVNGILGLRPLDPGGVPHHRELVLQELYTADPDSAAWWQEKVSRAIGFPVGPSSGAAMEAAVRLARETGGNVATVFPDHGFNYM
jgi:cysteine synthase